MRKSAVCICENKVADQMCGNCTVVTAQLISAFVFASQIVHPLYFLNLKFHASSHLLLLYSLVCVEPGQKPAIWLKYEMKFFDMSHTLRFGSHMVLWKSQASLHAHPCLFCIH